MKIRAAVLHTMSLPMPYAQSQPMKIESVDLAPPGAGEVLVKSVQRVCVIPIYLRSTATDQGNYRWCSAMKHQAKWSSSARA
jgi:Zn-dependent alcohol dehydrogenase